MPQDEHSSARRAPKGKKRERTRARLVEAASELIREKGYERTTLAEVAQRAGMTTGAIYGNFRNRDDLFMAVAEVRGAPIVPKLRPGMSFAEIMRASAEAVIEALPQRKAAMLGTLGFHAHALTHEELRSRVVAETAAIYRQMVEFTRSLTPPGVELPISPELLVPALHALTDGLVLHRVLTPELVSDDVIYAAFAAFAGPRPDQNERKPTPPPSATPR